MAPPNPTTHTPWLVFLPQHREPSALVWSDQAWRLLGCPWLNLVHRFVSFLLTEPGWPCSGIAKSCLGRDFTLALSGGKGAKRCLQIGLSRWSQQGGLPSHWCISSQYSIGSTFSWWIRRYAGTVIPSQAPKILHYQENMDVTVECWGWTCNREHLEGSAGLKTLPSAHDDVHGWTDRCKEPLWAGQLCERKPPAFPVGEGVQS